MKKILITLAVLFVLMLGAAVHLYISLSSQQQALFEQGEKWAKNNTAIVEVTGVQKFNGKKDYLVIQGKDKQGEQMLAWYREGFQRVIHMDEVYASQSLKEHVLKEYPVSKWVHITPGIDEERTFWEVVFIDEEDKLHYLYFDLYTGDFMRTYKLHSLKQ